VWPASQQPVRFTVRARSGSGDAVVLDDTVPPGGGSGGEAGGWREATVELPGPAGEVELTFDSSAAGPPAGGLAVWSSPEVLAPATAAGAPAGGSGTAAGTANAAAAPDVVLISVDTLRADHLSLYGYPRSTSPAIDAWAAGRSAVFERAVVQATWTLPSHTSMLTGVEAYRHGVNFNRPAPRRLITLAERLRGAGYRTVAITGGGFVHPEFGLGQGFERFAYWPSWRLVADELPDHLERTLGLLAEPQGRPLFLFFHTYEVHHSSIPRRPEIWRFGKVGPLARLTIERQPETVENGFQMIKRWGIRRDGRPELPPELGGFPADVYDSRIAFMDRHVGRLLETLAGRSRPTVVALTSDHGELLGEDGLAGHYSLHDGNSYVPLVLSAPSMPAGERRLGCQVRSIDLVPTLVELAGLPAPTGIDGGSLVPVLEEGCGRAPRRAVTYGANGNRGVGLRVADRFAVEYNDAVWQPLAGHRLVRPLHPDENGAAVPPDAEVDALVEGLGRAFLATVPGLRLRFDNPGPELLTGTIEGPPVGTAKLKSFDLPGPVIEYGGPAVARFTVPPGAGYHLIIEDPGERWLEVRIESPGPPATERIELSDVDEATRPLRLTPGPDGRWARATGPAPTRARPTILIWRVGRPGEAAEPPEEIDPELRKRLEALGYL
jgi:arylsulfatase A-like enzyme